MPARIVPLVTNEFYHIVNRGVGAIPVFKNSWDYQRFIQTFQFYQHDELPMRFSKFLALPKQEREDLFLSLSRSLKLLVEIIAYCLMPNHFHFFVKQKSAQSIDSFMQSLGIRYTMYFNRKYKRVGSLFQAVYKAVLVSHDEQFVYLSKYIHKQTLASKDETLQGWREQPSSYPEYLRKRKTEWVHPEELLSYFSETNPKFSYKSFVEEKEDDYTTIQNVIIDE